MIALAKVADAAPLALEIRGLTKAFGGLRVTRGVNLAIAPGERRLIIGPNGAGKTTLFNQITGEITPDAGTIHLMGSDITRVASRKRAHLGLSRTYQIITLFPHDTIVRNVSLALLGLSPLRWNPFVDMDRQDHLVAGAPRSASALVILSATRSASWADCLRCSVCCWRSASVDRSKVVTTVRLKLSLLH